MTPRDGRFADRVHMAASRLAATGGYNKFEYAANDAIRIVRATDAALADLESAIADDAPAAPDALLCIGCGVDALGGANGKVAIYVGDMDIGPWCKRCHACMQAELADRSEDPDAPAAPDDSARALAKLGAWLVRQCHESDTGYGFNLARVAFGAHYLDEIAQMAGVHRKADRTGYGLAPGIADAVQRLLKEESHA